MTQPTDQAAPAHQRYAALIGEAEAAATLLDEETGETLAVWTGIVSAGA